MIQKYLNSLNKNKNVITNFMEGQLWQKKYSKENRMILPLHLFADDFEMGNALGSHAGKQKLCGVYIILPFLPPHQAKKLYNIFLVTLFYSKYRKLFGNRAVFKKVIEEINFLSEYGIQININNKIITVYFELGLILGDNLGVNGVCGFAESFWKSLL